MTVQEYHCKELHSTTLSFSIHVKLSYGIVYSKLKHRPSTERLGLQSHMRTNIVEVQNYVVLTW